MGRAVIFAYTTDMKKQKQSRKDELLHCCLYFTANTLAREITRMAEEEFRITGLTPPHAFLLMLVNNEPGISQKQLGEKLRLAPSTVTRFIDRAESRGLVRRKTKGKNTFIHSTEKGEKLQAPIEKSWENLYRRYTGILGEKKSDRITAMIDDVCTMLGD